MERPAKPELNNKKVLALSVFGIALASFVLLQKPVNPAVIPGASRASILSGQPDALNNHKLIYYDQKLFFEGVAKANKNNSIAPNDAAGGIIPHHLLPSSLLSGFFKNLQGQNPKRIILLGPNHNELGYYNSISSLDGWQTPFGTVQPDQKTVNGLADKDLVHINENVIENEHSVASIMPYIKFYLPGARVVPIIVRGVMGQPEAQKLADEIAGYRDDQTIIISAVDFSHYLSAAAAEQKDEITYKAMKDFDYKKILSFNNDYTCSPQSIAILLMAMKDLGKTNFNLQQHTNSGLMENNLYMETTSYFSILFN